MSFVRHRGVSQEPLGGLGFLGCRPVGCGSPVVWLPPAVPCPSSPFSGSDSFPQLFPHFCQGDCFDCCGGGSPHERSNRASSFRSGVLQSPLCHPQGHRGLATSDRSLTPQPFGSGLKFPHGDFRFGSPISSSGGVDGVLDLQDAYLQVLVHPSSRHYLRFCVGTSVLQFRALCFGLSSAPQVFT